jgi:hypothetical protein
LRRTEPIESTSVEAQTLKKSSKAHIQAHRADCHCLATNAAAVADRKTGSECTCRSGVYHHHTARATTDDSAANTAAHCIEAATSNLKVIRASLVLASLVVVSSGIEGTSTAEDSCGTVSGHPSNPLRHSRTVAIARAHFAVFE